MAQIQPQPVQIPVQQVQNQQNQQPIQNQPMGLLVVPQQPLQNQQELYDLACVKTYPLAYARSITKKLNKYFWRCDCENCKRANLNCLLKKDNIFPCRNGSCPVLKFLIQIMTVSGLSREDGTSILVQQGVPKDLEDGVCLGKFIDSDQVWVEIAHILGLIPNSKVKRPAYYSCYLKLIYLLEKIQELVVAIENPKLDRHSEGNRMRLSKTSGEDVFSWSTEKIQLAKFDAWKSNLFEDISFFAEDNDIADLVDVDDINIEMEKKEEKKEEKRESRAVYEIKKEKRNELKEETKPNEKEFLQKRVIM